MEKIKEEKGRHKGGERRERFGKRERRKKKEIWKMIKEEKGRHRGGGRERFG